MQSQGPTQGLTSSLRVSESEPYFLPHMLRTHLKLNTDALSRPESVSPRNLALSLRARLSSLGSSCPSRNGTGYYVPHHLPLPCANHSRCCRCVPRGPELSESSRAGHVEQSNSHPMLISCIKPPFITVQSCQSARKAKKKSVRDEP